MEPSRIFDRAVDYYDRTRSWAPEVTARVVEALQAEIGEGKALEIGVGTGRIAVPLSEAGVEVTGVDLSRPMLDALKAKSPEGSLKIVLGDAARLPFADSVFDAAIAAHVLHLIPNWRAACGELVRSVGTGGRLLIDLGHHAESDWSEELQLKFSELAGIERRFLGVVEMAELDAHLAGLGASSRPILETMDVRLLSPAEAIDGMEKGIWSFTWSADETARRRAARALREWAEDRYGPLEAPRETVHRISWTAYDLA